MERPRRDKEPPHKRRKPVQEPASDDGGSPRAAGPDLKFASDGSEPSSGAARENGTRTGRERHWREAGCVDTPAPVKSPPATPTPVTPPPAPISAWTVTRAFRSRWDLGPGHRPPRPPEERGSVATPRPLQPGGVSTRGPAPPGLQPRLPSAPVRHLRRRWETCTSHPRPPGGGAMFDFSVLSYNILSQQLLQDNAYLYRHCPPHILTWDYRLPNLLAEIRRLDADVLCLQEVQEDHYQDQIGPALRAAGFQCEFKKRTGGKPDGCAVAFRTSRLSLVSAHPVEFYRPGDALLDRDNVGLVLLLRPGGPGSDAPPLCVANTHLLYNPRRGDVKLAQLAVLLAEVRRRARRPDGSLCPVLLCGDFNSTPWSPLYSFLTSGRLRYQGLEIGMVSGQENSSRGQRLLQSPIWSDTLGITPRCRYQKQRPTGARTGAPTGAVTVEDAVSDLSVEDVSRSPADRWTIEHGLRLRSSYQHRLVPDGRPEITTFHSRTAMTVDYILYSPESSSCPSGRGLQLLGRLSLVGWSELEAVHGLPNRLHSSDHLPLLARFRLSLAQQPIGGQKPPSSRR